MQGFQPHPAAAQGGVAVGPIEGARLYPAYLDRRTQERLRDEIFEVIALAPLYRPVMPRTAKPLSVRMTNCGPLGWITDVRGYRYEPRHPETGRPWPPIPNILLEIWEAVAAYPAPPEACLVNIYDANARMGAHRDFDEEDFNAPVVSLSLGDSALFRIGGLERKGSTQSLTVASGDVIVLGGAARRAYHGVDRIFPGTSTLLPKGGRINLTLRRVQPPSAEPCYTSSS